jgi:hypothetical protein
MSFILMNLSDTPLSSSGVFVFFGLRGTKHRRLAFPP